MLLRRRRRGGHGHLLKLLPLVEWRTLAATAVWWCGCLLGDTCGPDNRSCCCPTAATTSAAAAATAWCCAIAA